MDAFTEGRYGAIWKVGFSSCSRFRLTSLHTGASGSTCMCRAKSLEVRAARHTHTPANAFQMVECKTSASSKPWVSGYYLKPNF